MEFLVITPAKNEAAFIEQTIQSMLTQNLRPGTWVIVNDGSDDCTGDIVNKYTGNYHWIKLINMPTVSEPRSGGSKVVNAFNAGLKAFAHVPYDVVVKLDADLSLPPDYFTVVADCFAKNADVGMCGGYCVIRKDGKLVKEASASYHLRGALKAYRKKCFQDIGGLQPIWAWDGIDGMTAMYCHWKIKILDLPVIHHRPTSSAYNALSHSRKSGFEAYRTRSGLFLSVLRSLVRISQKPLLLNMFCYLLGYVEAWRGNESRLVSAELGRFIRRFHYKRIFPL